MTGFAMWRRRAAPIVVVLLVVVAVTSPTLPSAVAADAATAGDGGHAFRAVDARPSQSLTITGNVAQPATYTAATLQALPQQQVVVAAMDGTRRTYRGVLLRDLLATAQPLQAGHFDLRRSIVVARATDGYLAVFSWAEIFNSAIGDGVLVAWSMDGAPLTDAEGAFALVSAADTKSGPRHVRWLEAIDLRRVAF